MSNFGVPCSKLRLDGVNNFSRNQRVTSPIVLPERHLESPQQSFCNSPQPVTYVYGDACPIEIKTETVVKPENHVLRDHCYVKRHIIEVPEPVEEMVVIDDVSSQVTSPYENVETIEIYSDDTTVIMPHDNHTQEFLPNEYSCSPNVPPSGSPDSSFLDPELDELLLGSSSENSDCEEKATFNISDIIFGIDSLNDLNVSCDNVDKSMVDVNFDDFKVEEFFAHANSLSDFDNLHV